MLEYYFFLGELCASAEKTISSAKAQSGKEKCKVFWK
jgi:hypothetical protein